MTLLQQQLTSHRRLNPLTGEWILVSPQRTLRPWQGQLERSSPPPPPAYDRDCYLCPGNERANGAHNPDYNATFWFPNDFSALDEHALRPQSAGEGLLVAEAESGICRVLCYSPRHDLTLATMNIESVRTVVDLWVDQHRELSRRGDIAYVQIFENRGESMGCSNPHPHGQLWATETVPNEPAKEQAGQLTYSTEHSSCLLCDYIALEMQRRERVVIENEEFIVLVPFWAVWPFETLVIPKKHLRDFAELTNPQRLGLADVLQEITVRYDNLFETPFPYSMGFHQRPMDSKDHAEWHFHAHFYPPLLRSASVRKFMVGFEMLGSPQRDITSEAAAETLRRVSGVHFTKK